MDVQLKCKGGEWGNGAWESGKGIYGRRGESWKRRKDATENAKFHHSHPFHNQGKLTASPTCESSDWKIFGRCSPSAGILGDVSLGCCLSNFYYLNLTNDGHYHIDCRSVVLPALSQIVLLQMAHSSSSVAIMLCRRRSSSTIAIVFRFESAKCTEGGIFSIPRNSHIKIIISCVALRKFVGAFTGTLEAQWKPKPFSFQRVFFLLRTNC